MLRRMTIIALLIVTSSSVCAQYDHQRKERSPSGSRDTRFEASVILAYQNGADKTSEGGSSLDIDSVSGWGISLGWNWTSKWNIAYRLVANKPKYLAIVVPEDTELGAQTFEQKLSKFSHQFNLTYNFSEKALTPYVLAGIGWTKIDSNVISGPPTTGCWWDPWWGYICFSEWDTYGTTKFSYNLGLGLRWDINNAFFTKATYSREFLSLKNGTLNFDMAILEFGMMF